MQISRVTRSKSAAKRAYDRLSHIYDRLSGSSEAPLMRLGLEMLAIELGESVLEIGSGTGTALLEICSRVGEAGRVYGLDLSRGMLHMAQDRLAGAGRLRTASQLEGDGVRLPYQSESMNAVFISFTLELFDTPEIPIVLAECQRVLQPEGRLGVVSMMKTGQSGWIVRLYEWFHETLPAYVDCRPIDAGGMIQAAGFRQAKRQVRSMWGLPVEVVVARKEATRTHL
jgi:demethylmenaquinone methyltransferase/2-methoxy-6-polyprenyl-1,4-benzoquinol methylase